MTVSFIFVKLICSYCRRDMGEKPPLDDPGPTHSMCVDCSEHFGRMWKGLRLGEYLDDFDAPVLAVNEEGRVVAANQKMAHLLGKSERELFGLLGGEVMACVYSRLEGGCGRTEHCAACTVRRTVTQTMTTGDPLVDVPAHIDQDDARLELKISTRKRGDVVELTVTRAVPSSSRRPSR